MKKVVKSMLLMGALTMVSGMAWADGLRLHFPMTVEDGCLREEVSGMKVAIEGRYAPMAIAAPDGQAWRTDGYTSAATAPIGNILEGNRMTASIRVAVDTYPIIRHEQATEEQIPIVSCLNAGEKSGFGFFIGRTGRYSFRMYSGGELVTVEAPGILPLWEWKTLSATVDGTAVKLYADGELIGTAQCKGGVRVNGPLHIGWDKTGDNLAGAALGGFNGAIDDIRVADTVEAIATKKEGFADLNLPADRYENDIMRPRFHAMPQMNWTNETHGLIKYGGKYHLFFQKTGSAPIMSHQHWGHLVSTDLINWKDDTPALAPGESYDIKGCWSGCVFTDPDINNGKPTILYTGVNYAEPFAAIAYSQDDNLRNWTKDTRNPWANINQTGGNHFRDTYFFRDGNQKYFMIGCSTDGKASTLLYRYDNGSWVPDGYFYKAPDRGTDGEFAEMPNVVKFGDRWMMTTTPLGSARGVTCNYRIGRIEQGRFVPDAHFQNPKQVDVLGMAGFGLMSPSPCTDENGKVIAMGIVADKLPTEFNLQHGYAHLYSLPREWSLDADGDLLQKPYSGLEALRTKDADRQFHLGEAITLEGSLNIAPVRGREIEAMAKFEVGDAPFGFRFYKDIEGKCATLSYNPANHELTVDFGGIDRYPQDEGNPNRFSAILEKVPAKGEEMKIHLFIDHSIVDVFINDRYASSVRVFPRDTDASVVEAFAEGPTRLMALDAYIMNENPAGDPEIVVPEDPEIPETSGKVAMLTGYADYAALQAGSDDEKEAVKFFTDKFPQGTLLFAGDLARIKADAYDCVWIHIDRDGIGEGWQNLPAPFNSQAALDCLKAYVADGGNLYVSAHATQLVQALGRTDQGITIFSSGDGGVGNDIWQVNITPKNALTLSHPIYYGLPTSDRGYGIVIDLLGNEAGLHRQDHNCLWDTNRYGGPDEFAAHNNAKVLGSWGHDGGQPCAGIVEFLPEAKASTKEISKTRAEKRKGTIIANGLAAYEWSCKKDGGANGVNLCQANIEALTSNILAYLSPKVSPDGELTSVEDISADEKAEPVYYSLQGYKVENPVRGLYIKVTGKKVEKVMIR